MIVDIFVETGRCLNMTFVNSLKAAGSYVFPLIMGILCNWGLGLTTGYILGCALGIGVAGIFAGTATDECINSSSCTTGIKRNGLENQWWTGLIRC